MEVYFDSLDCAVLRISLLLYIPNIVEPLPDKLAYKAPLSISKLFISIISGYVKHTICSKTFSNKDKSTLLSKGGNLVLILSSYKSFFILP